MPDQRAVNNLSAAWWSARQAVEVELRRAGYDPRTLDELPEPGACGCALATAITRWREIEDRLDVARRRPIGRT